ncbi:hypothetical protein DFH07DRAFT_368297 [Mycena maculata]|uniref:F-box domain-containing protein n=1 Tax=Mycena maculata TaxID=230809 RepID=A0AAD7MFH4_9AGAR|nr:hypothetical protein DFH07DRAFT_368297 [Mycena maculata]
MALSRLATIPLELQEMASSELDPFDLLSLSHVSAYWRAFVLNDKRWAEWFSIITNTSDETLEEVLTRLNVLDMFPKRTLVYRCLLESCTVCGAYAQQLFIPHMKRVCDKCLPGDEFSIMPLSAALAKYDLRERELYGLLTLESVDPKRNSKRPMKLVSEAQAKKRSAVRKYGTEALLTAHLECKKTAARSTYTARSEDYRNAVSTRTALQEKGNLEAAEAVVLGHTGRKIPKAFPAYPPILLQSTRTVDRGAACFASLPLLVVGNTIVVDPCEDDDDEDEE